jgi:hypothetical protein
VSVQRDGPLVIHGSVRCERKRITGLHADGFGARPGRSHIASEVVRRQIYFRVSGWQLLSLVSYYDLTGYWGVIIRVLANVLVNGKLGGSVRKLLEDVVC